VDALRLGYRFGFVGGGDLHDGRPGDDLHNLQKEPKHYCLLPPQGFTACRAAALSRESVYDAIKTRRTYATTRRRIYLEWEDCRQGRARIVRACAAAEDGIRRVAVVVNGEDLMDLRPDRDPRVVTAQARLDALGSKDFCYLRVETNGGGLAWSSPMWGTED
jgi:hypothetical protein